MLSWRASTTTRRATVPSLQHPRASTASLTGHALRWQVHAHALRPPYMTSCIFEVSVPPGGTTYTLDTVAALWMCN
eukprot:500386-Pleurochrysis_carterae.AAC.2